MAAGPDQVGGYASSSVILRAQPSVRPMVREGRLTLVREAAAPRALRGAAAAGGAAAEADSTAVADAIARWHVASIKPVFEHEFGNPQLARQIGLDRYYRVTVPQGTDAPALVNELGRFASLVQRAELDAIGGVAETIPDDSNFNLLWGMQNTGQQFDGIAGTIGTDINVTDAWDVTTGDPNLVLAVLDAGITQHVEIVDRLIPGKNVAADPDNDDTSDVCSSHGSHVAGSAAATGDNGVGVAGVDWQCKIMPVRVLNSCSGIESYLAEGIIWATDHGADVLNMSLQYSFGSSVLQDAVEYAYAQDVPMIAAAGNQGEPELKFPARWPQTIAVGAIDNTGQRASYSNSGPELDVMGPGSWVWSLRNTTQYSYKNGTSMATPHVSGTVMLMRGLNPDLTSCEIKEAIQETAMDLGDPGFDEATGYGLLDAHAAILRGLPSVPGDLDRDGIVAVTDLLIVLGAWGPCPADCPPTCVADTNGDGTVSVEDLLFLLAQWPLQEEE